MLWVRSGPPAVCRSLGRDTAVFDSATGETHLLTELPALVLSVMDKQAVSVADLIERIAGPVQLATGDENRIVEALSYLESAELVESRSPDRA